MMTSEDGSFWDRRYEAEGAIWGNGPSPTALAAALHLEPGAAVLDVGCGYGRDLAFLARQGCRVYGTDMSPVGGRLAQTRLHEESKEVARFWLGRFEESDLPLGFFDAILCHRMAHLMLTDEEVGRFAHKVQEILKPKGLLCLGARNLDDLNQAEMVQLGPRVYEYQRRPGHRIRYWDDDAFEQAFGSRFTIMTLASEIEPETLAKPTPCHLTIMVAQRRNANGKGAARQKAQAAATGLVSSSMEDSAGGLTAR